MTKNIQLDFQKWNADFIFHVENSAPIFSYVKHRQVQFHAGKSSFKCTYAWSRASKVSDLEEARGIGWGGMWAGLKDVLDTCVPMAH